MAVRLVVAGACEDIILPCRSDTYFADANSCGHYYRCQGYQVWRNKCPLGTVSMRQGPRPCVGHSWQCDNGNPQARCAKETSNETEDNESCTLRFELPCKNETRFMDPVSCGHYLTCRNRKQGHVLGRKACDLPAQCHLMKNNQYCSSFGKTKCHKKGMVTIVGQPDHTVPNNEVTPNTDTSEVNNTALIVGLVMATVVSLLIVGFLVLIFYKKKQKKKRPPCLPALTVSAPIPINEPCQSIRYSQVNRPISILTYNEPNTYSMVSDTNNAQLPESDFYKGNGYNVPSEHSGLYEEIESCRGGLASPAYSSNNDVVNRPGKEILEAGDGMTKTKTAVIVPRRPIRRMADSRPLSDEFHRAKNAVVPRPSRPFSLTSLTSLFPPRLPLEPPRDSCSNLNYGYSHPYFILPSNRPLDSPNSPTGPLSATRQGSLSSPGASGLGSPTSPQNGPKYFILENVASSLDADAVSVDTTYCEIDDAHFLQDNFSVRKSYPATFA
ncbi:uncharacterized protein LOC135471722 [Liolophura sinensis]|uniref:uncharacterized protein LOC135471722 n=1 Tax=Liolophura sinensis TaxID=3198878 RepID=UPI003158BEB3